MSTTKAYLLVKAEPNKTREVYKELAELSGIRTFQPTTGRFDAVLQLESQNTKELSEFVVNKVRAIEGVKDTETLVVPTL